MAENENHYQNCTRNESDLSTVSQGNLLIDRSEKRLRIIAIPMKDRLNVGYYRAIDEFKNIVANNLKHEDTSYWFEDREEVFS